MKKCRKCGRLLPLDDYYAHSGMTDGHLNICKECTKKRVSLHRERNIDDVRKYDRERGKLKHRMEQATVNTKKSRKNILGYCAAHSAVCRAIRDGKITRPSVCEWCGKEHSRIEGHHQDYSKRLLVTWLCSPCHKTLHSGKSRLAEKMRSLIKIPEEER